MGQSNLKNLAHTISGFQAVLAALSIAGVWLITCGLDLFMRRVASRWADGREWLVTADPAGAVGGAAARDVRYHRYAARVFYTVLDRVLSVR